MLTIARVRNIRLVMENPWGTQSYLQRDFITSPSVIDKDRTRRGDLFRKPTAYWFINAEPEHGETYMRLHKPIRVKKDADGFGRSIISKEYAHNFICDFILGKPTAGTQLSLF